MKASLLQSTTSPILSQNDLNEFISKQESIEQWHRIAIVSDRENLLVLLMDEDNAGIVQVVRVCFDTLDETKQALQQLHRASGSISLYSLSNPLRSCDDLQAIQDSLSGTTPFAVGLDAVTDLFDHQKDGRGSGISTATAREVELNSMGYCMFEGCGEHLGSDLLTGRRGNYRYLAHIIASAQNGPRGGPESARLSDEVTNIMVLCDKHHRLIDRIAVSEYNVARLRAMRAEFIDNSKAILASLAYPQIPTVLAFWPIRGCLPDRPTAREYAVALKPLTSRPSPTPHVLHQAPASMSADDHWWQHMASGELTRLKVHYQSLFPTHGAKVAFFVLGPMAMMIGLGALLGDKNALVPIPRLRESGWNWARSHSHTEPFYVEDYEQLDPQTDEVAVIVSLTDFPAAAENTAEQLATRGVPSIRLNASARGNDCIGHPDDANALRVAVGKLLHGLKNNKGVRRVHLLPCAPNAACVEIGRALEYSHPSVCLYDMGNEGSVPYMVPRLTLHVRGPELTCSPVDPHEVEFFHQYFQTLQ